MPSLQELVVLLAIASVQSAPAAEHVAPIHELGAVEVEPTTTDRHEQHHLEHQQKHEQHQLKEQQHHLAHQQKEAQHHLAHQQKEAQQHLAHQQKQQMHHLAHQQKQQMHHQQNQVYQEHQVVLQQYPMITLPVQWHQQIPIIAPQWSMNQEPVQEANGFSQTQPQKPQVQFSPPRQDVKHPESNTVTPQKTTSLPKKQVAITEATPALLNVQGLRPIIERGLLELCLGLERASNGPDSTENTVLAPLSVAAMAAILLAGARGQTKKELEHLFGIDQVPHRQDEVHRTLGLVLGELENTAGHTLAWGSGIFLQEGEPLEPDFLRLAREVYRSEVVSVDFRGHSHQTASHINRWVANRTEGHIQTLLEDVLDTSTSMIIANVFFFRATWEQPFLHKYTRLQNFYVSGTETLRVPMMVGMMSVGYWSARDSHSVIGLPYKGGESVMYFILPHKKPRQFVADLTPEKLRHFINQTTVQPVIVAVPRMRVEATLELSGPLTALGAGSMFRPGVADLSGITGADRHGYHVDEMLHKVSLEVTETGTVGAAASATSILRDGSTPVFRADKPFLFFVYHKRTGSVLFWGSVFRPQPVLDKV